MTKQPKPGEFAISILLRDAVERNDAAVSAASLLAHPSSHLLSHKTVRKLYGIATGSIDPTRADVQVIGLFAEILAYSEGARA